jgi:hypothetical protein
MTVSVLTFLHSRRRGPVLLIIGIALLVILQALHFASVLGWTQNTPLDGCAEIVRANMTPLAWCAYLLTLLGLLAVWDGRSWLWRHWQRFGMCWLWSVSAWCYFDWINFYFMRDPRTGLRAWEYINLPPRFDDRLCGYLIAFGAIAPGMFLTAEVLQRLGLRKLGFQANAPSASAANPAAPESDGKDQIRARRGRIHRILPLAVLLLGIVLAPIPFVFGTPLSNLAVWVGTWALLDPINRYCGRPSIVGDWLAGRWGRTLALGSGGLICGFLWEFWNYWAWSKWIYHLPFLGTWEHYKYFEMPVPGLLGFIAFGLETWTMWQTALLVLAPYVEGERGTPADQRLALYSCL